MKQTVAMLGSGAWGTAVATVLAKNGHVVKLWCHSHAVSEEINNHRSNEKYLPGIKLHENIQAVTDLDEATCGVKWVFEAIPVKFLREMLEKAQSCFDSDQVWVVLSKGIEQDTLLLPTQIIDDVFGSDTHKAVFAGPSFADDVAREQLTGVSVAATHCDLGFELQALLQNDYFRPYIATDMIGVQVGAALKNVITLGVGLLDGAGYTDNTKAFFITHGLHEMVLCAQALGGERNTLYGFSGVGDLVLTSMGSLSRNLMVGKKLGAGDELQAILDATGAIPEGVNTIKSVYQLMRKHDLNLPICQGIYEVVFENKKLEVMLKQLMAEPLDGACEL